jgi:hypothetical protein
MSRTIPSTLDDALEVLRRWKTESRRIRVTYISTKREVVAFRFNGKVTEVEGPAVRVTGSSGYFAVRLDGAAVNPPLDVYPEYSRDMIKDLRASLPVLSMLELALPAGSFIALWEMSEA